MTGAGPGVQTPGAGSPAGRKPGGLKMKAGAGRAFGLTEKGLRKIGEIAMTDHTAGDRGAKAASAPIAGRKNHVISGIREISGKRKVKGRFPGNLIVKEAGQENANPVSSGSGTQERKGLKEAFPKKEEGAVSGMKEKQEDGMGIATHGIKVLTEAFPKREEGAVPGMKEKQEDGMGIATQGIKDLIKAFPEKEEGAVSRMKERQEERAGTMKNGPIAHNGALRTILRGDFPGPGRQGEGRRKKKRTSGGHPTGSPVLIMKAATPEGKIKKAGSPARMTIYA